MVVKADPLDLKKSYTKVVLTPHSDKPDAYVRKKVAFVRKNTQKDGEWSDKLSLKGQEQYSVISNVCMHLGCPVQASTSGFVCPCHGGVYNARGEVEGGPPVRHTNVEVHKPLGDGRFKKQGNAHLDDNGNVIP